MNLKIVCVEVFAIIAGYLIFSTCLASATNVKIYYNGAYQTSVQYVPQASVSRSVAVEGGNVRINITNATGSVSIEKVHVYKCKGLAPGACASWIPETSNGTFAAIYAWNSVADRTAGYPQKANFLILIKVRSSEKIFWTGFWQTIERSDASTYTPYESQISEMQVNAKTIDCVAAIRNYISDNRMVPFNPQWVAGIVFPAASGLYLMKSGLEGLEVPQLTVSESSQNQLTGIDQDYGFALPRTSDVQFSPLTLRLNPSYNCGGGTCESGLGETQANCCLDCGCQTGYYCDVSGGCRQTSGISLSIYGTPQTAVSNCNQQHVLNMPVRINNPPTGLAIASTKYRLGSGPEQASSCTGGSQIGYIFSCPVTVPAVPNCDTGNYRVGPNYMNFSVTYTDGKATVSRYIVSSFPDVTIGSYECGNRNCESSLGENAGMCCYDCGCAAGYCDSRSPSNGSCRQDPANDDLRVSGVTPSRFYTHSPGDSVSFLAQVANGPATLSVTGQSCSLGCARSDSQPCSASCSISCLNGAFGSGTYNSSCTMGFTIPAYDPLKVYSLFPVLNLSVSYSNGSLGSVQKVLSNSFSTINIGSHWCGDKKCDPDESQGSCCYDCGCAAGYCDTRDVQYRSQGDSCRTDPRIEIDDIGSTSFTDTYQQHIINVTGHINPRPSGISLSPSCVLGGQDGLPCYVTCEAGNDSQSYAFLCQVFVPSIDYNSSRFFDLDARKITLAQNSLNITFSYNNGNLKAQDTVSASIPEIIINVIPKCGSGTCESEIGESRATCCLDCNCGGGNFCYTGKIPNGECLSNSALNMRIQSVDPNPANCTIFQYGKECAFTQSERVYPIIINPPSDLRISEAYYRVGLGGKYTNFTSLTCLKLSDGEGNYSCAFTLEKSANQTAPGDETRILELKMSLAYTSGGAPVVKNVSDTFTFTVKRAYSDAVASCLLQMQSLNKKIKGLKSDKTLYTILAIIFFIISLIYWILFIISCFSETGCTLKLGTIATIAAIIGGCGLSYVLSKLSEIDGKIQKLQAEKQSICAAEGFGGLSRATGSSTNWVYTIGQIYGSVTCAIGVSGAVGGTTGGTNSLGNSASLYM